MKYLLFFIVLFFSFKTEAFNLIQNPTTLQKGQFINYQDTLYSNSYNPNGVCGSQQKYNQISIGGTVLGTYLKYRSYGIGGISGAKCYSDSYTASAYYYGQLVGQYKDHRVIKFNVLPYYYLINTKTLEFFQIPYSNTLPFFISNNKLFVINKNSNSVLEYEVEMLDRTRIKYKTSTQLPSGYIDTSLGANSLYIKGLGWYYRSGDFIHHINETFTNVNVIEGYNNSLPLGLFSTLYGADSFLFSSLSGATLVYKKDLNIQKYSTFSHTSQINRISYFTSPYIYFSDTEGKYYSWNMNCKTPGYTTCKIDSITGNNYCSSDTGVISPYKEICENTLVFKTPFSYGNLSQNNTAPYVSQNIPSGEGFVLNTEMYLLQKQNENISENTIHETQSIGDPVNLSTGEFVYDNTLMQFPGKGIPFSLDVTYKSKVYYNGPIGNNFDFAYNQFLVDGDDGSIYFHNGSLGVYTFQKNTDGTYVSHTGIKATLEEVGDEYILTINKKDILTFGINKKLKEKKDIFGNKLSFTYNSNAQLVEVQDTLGRSYLFSYYTHSHIKDITAFNGDKVEFTYFSSGVTLGSEFDLKEITLQNGTKTKKVGFTYTSGATFEDAHNIVSLIDSENNTYVTNVYENDRVVSQSYGNETIYYNYTLSGSKVAENKVTDREGNVVMYSFDENGNTTKKIVKMESGESVYSYEYDSDGYIIKEVLPLGNGYSYKYDSSHNRIESRFKNNGTTPDSSSDIVTKYTYNLDFNVPTQIIIPNEAIINLILDEKGNIIRKEILGVEDIDGNKEEIIETYEYNAAGEIISIIDGNGNKTFFKYENGNVISKVQGTGNAAITTLYSHDENGNITSITDGNGNVSQINYDDFKLLSSLTSPGGSVTEHTYNNLGKKVNEKIILGNSETKESIYEYDILDNPVKITEDIDNQKKKTTITKYDKNGNITEIKDGNNAAISFTYNETGYITEKKILSETQNSVTSYTYGENNRLIKEIKPNGSEIYLEYDLFDRVTKEIYSNGTYIRYTYDREGNILEVKIYSGEDTLIQKTSSTYDAIGRKTSETRYLLETNTSLTEKIYYDAIGNIIKKVVPNNTETNYKYDAFDRLKEITDILGNKILQNYDKNGNVIQKKIVATNGKTITTNYEYDKDNRRVKETDTLGDFVSYSYNNLGQITSKKDKDGGVTGYTYDYLGNLLSESHGGKTIYYEYDINGNNTKIIDANRNVTIYEYDDLNRLISQTYPDGSILKNEYDSLGNLIKRTDPNGTIITNSYDSLGRLTQRDITPGNEVLGVTHESYAYDSLGRLTGGNDSQGNKLTFNYDSLGRLTEEINAGKEVNYTYDQVGNITSLNNINYIYDEANRLLEVTRGGESIVNNNYDSLSLTRQELGNGVISNFTYDELQRLKTINYSLDIPSLAYSYNSQGNITSNGIENYNYDALDRIQKASYSREEKNRNIEERFSYDMMGNRQRFDRVETKGNQGNDHKKENDNKKEKGETFSQEYMINSLNQYTEVTSSDDHGKERVTNYIYDNNGNLKQDNEFKYFYDYKNRLVRVTSPHPSPLPEGEGVEEKIIAEYTYDILGRRVKKETPESTTNYLYAGDNAIEEIPTEKETGEITKRENIYSNTLDDILLTIVTNPDDTVEKLYYTKNHLGSTIAITDENGIIQEEYAYDIFGKAYLRNGKSDNYREAKESKVTRLFTGREYDSETGLYYLRARYYDANLGRFISRDPIDIADDINLYTYVGNNPMMYIDRMGRAKKFVDAYDRYLDLKSQIYSDDNGVYTREYMNMNELDQILFYIEYIKSRDYARMLHYNRNQFNANLPKNDEAAILMGWKKMDNLLAALHQINIPEDKWNDKWVSPDGHREVIYLYDSNGDIIVNDETNMGTYNFFDPDNWSGHYKYDMNPYKEWGNGWNDTSNIGQRSSLTRWGIIHASK